MERFWPALFQHTSRSDIILGGWAYSGHKQYGNSYEKIPLHVNYKFLHYKGSLSLFSWVPVCVCLYFQLISHSKRGTWEAEEAGLVQPREEKALGDLTAVPARRVLRRWSQALRGRASRRTRNYIEAIRVRVDTRKNFWTMRTAKQWSRLHAPSWQVFKSQLNKALSNLVWPHSWPSFEQKVRLEISWGPFRPELSCDPVNCVCHYSGCCLPLKKSMFLSLLCFHLLDFVLFWCGFFCCNTFLYVMKERVCKQQCELLHQDMFLCWPMYFATECEISLQHWNKSGTELHCNFVEKRTQWFISRPFTCQKDWKVNSIGVFNLFWIKNNEN